MFPGGPHSLTDSSSVKLKPAVISSVTAQAFFLEQSDELTEKRQFTRLSEMCARYRARRSMTKGSALCGICDGWGSPASSKRHMINDQS